MSSDNAIPSGPTGMSGQLQVPETVGKMEASSQASTTPRDHWEIVTLNVGGRRFSTSRQTLTWIPDSFFSSLMSGRIPSMKDDTGAIFVDRDPDVFAPILNYLRTRNLDFKNVDLKTLKHEAEFYGILPLVKRLAVCEELETSNCGDLLFHSQLTPPVFGQTPSLESVSQPQLPLGLKTDFSSQVLQLTGHGNCIAVAYNHCVCVLGVRESRGWELMFTTPPLERVPHRIALNVRSVAGASGGPTLAVVIGNEIKVWSCSQSPRVLATYDLKIPVDGLFFIGTQLVAISNTGKVAIWQSVQRHWQLQELAPISSYDTAGSFLLLGCSNGSIYHIDMEKFPVRMKDNDLLVTQLFEDPFKESITALSVYITPISFLGSDQNWMEVAYGTQAGSVRVVVRHPENIGQAPQIYQSYNVHTCPILRVVLGEKHLISVCAENHVRTWTVTRFRGRISTQPGSNPVASFKVLSLEGAHSLFYPINSIGPFGERDEEQVFIQRIIPETNKIFVRFCSTGKRVCEINSVDGSNISVYCVHECEAANRIGMRPRRFIFTGHLNGSIQVWDLTTALEVSQKSPDNNEGGPTKEELLELLQNCDVSASRMSSAVSSRAPSPSPSLMSIMFPGFRPSGRRVSHSGTPINTPCLGRSTNNGGVTSSVTANVFQPIHVSNSNHSIGSSTVQNPSVVVEDLEDGEANETPSQDTSCHTQPDCIRETNNSGPPVRGAGDSHSLPRPQKKKSSVHHEGGDVTHQRSRSNEIDYSVFEPSSSTSTLRSGSSAFKSPPGNARKFRPVSVDSAHSSVYGGVSDSSAFGSRSTSGVTSSSESTLTPKNSRPPSRISSDEQSFPAVQECDPTAFNYFSSTDDNVKVMEC